MEVSYKKLWKILIDKDMKKKDLQAAAGISWASVTKLSKNETVSMDVLMKVCKVLECNIGDIVDTPWQIPYKVACKVVVNDIYDSPYVDQLSQEQLEYLQQFDNIAILDLDAQYDPPYTLEQIKAHYPENIYVELANDPVHRWRAETGIELIHKEPTEEELDRIWKNWQLMTQKMKDISDKKSIELFGCTNADHYVQLKVNIK